MKIISGKITKNAVLYCQRCNATINKGQEYFIYRKEKFFRGCIRTDEYPSRAKSYNGTFEKFTHYGVS